LFLTAEEHLALMHAGLFAKRAGYSTQQALERALRTIRQNSAANQRTDISQKPNEDAALQRNVHPYGLIHWRERWYLVGYCHLRRETRIFRVDRMQTCTTTNEMFVKRDGFSASSFFTARQIYEATSKEEVVQLSLEGADEDIEDLSSHLFLGPCLIEKRLREASFPVEARMIDSYLPHILLAYGRLVSIGEPVTLVERVGAL